MPQNVKESMVYVKEAKEIWDQLEMRFSLTNGTRKYKLNKAVYDLRQKDKSVLEYYTKIKALSDDINAMRNLPPITSMTPEVLSFVKALNREREKERLFQFLSGLEEDYAAKRSHVLMFSPLLTIEDACARSCHEEAQRKPHKEDKIMMETRAMLSKKEEWCSVCEMKGHSNKKCWKVIGYPRWHPKSNRQQKFEEGAGSRSIMKRNKKDTNKLENGLVLKNVLLVLEFEHNLLSVNKLVSDEGYKAMFHSKYCIIKAIGVTRNGLYYLRNKGLKEVKEEEGSFRSLEIIHQGVKTQKKGLGSNVTLNCNGFNASILNSQVL
ncbi:Translation initiation factor IF-3 [Bienertia sinuspersici]